MAKKMLIDATHVEETRVAVVEENRLVDFDYESKFRKQLKGSIFLAKVTRVEPSLQAAFVNFGGNRHGFLPFSEIHPDYYRIPIADREALIEEQKAEMEARMAEMEADDDDESDDEDANGDDDAVDTDESDDEADDVDGNKKRGGKGRGGKGRGRGRGRRSNARNKAVEMVGGDDVDGDTPIRPHTRKNYKIQEVVKRGQIMLIQASREERGNKGAAVSTYISLPGRYCVLMPNSPRAGGVSRKIEYKDRRRLREILDELKVPDGMSVIVRTAGVGRTKTEIKRDMDYLTKLWNNIRENTLESTAPALIHEEANLIRRAIRDIYTREVDEVIVSGDEGHKLAKDFMKMMIPSHVKKIQHYKEDDIPLFQRYHIENQIQEIGQTTATLKSGGYLVINPTEALVSIDVNSGRATKERHIEETALKTNLEAADEVARQLKLRDLGGLVVIDFIDMEDRRNNRKVENRLRDALSGDRARIQVGRISSFGLLELSRQRLNPSLTEAQFEQCPHCKGVGYIRSIDSAAIVALRALEEEGVRQRASEVLLQVPNDVALYILNNKRTMLAELEERYKFRVSIRVNEEIDTRSFEIEPLSMNKDSDDGDEGSNEPSGKAAENNQSQNKNQNQNNEQDQEQNQEGGSNNRRRGKRGGRGRGRNNNRDNNNENNNNDQSGALSGNESGHENAKNKDNSHDASSNNDQTQKDDKPKRGGGRKKKDDHQDADNQSAAESSSDNGNKADIKDDKPKRGRKPAAKIQKAAEELKEDKSSGETSGDKPKKTGGRKKKDEASSGDDKKDKDNTKSESKSGAKSKSDKSDSIETGPPSNDTEPVQKEYEVVNEAPPKKKKGWWSRSTD